MDNTINYNNILLNIIIRCMYIEIIRMQCVMNYSTTYSNVNRNCAGKHNCIKYFYVHILIIHNASLNGKSKNDCRS